MNIELQMLELIKLSLDQAWSLLQWWASISFGLIALAHFSARKLNLLFVTILLVLYTLFTAYWFINFWSVALQLLGHIQDLAALRETETLSKASEATIDSFVGLRGPIAFAILILCVVGTFCASSGYLIHRYRRIGIARTSEASYDFDS
jgi:hypothetical protein